MVVSQRHIVSTTVELESSASRRNCLRLVVAIHFATSAPKHYQPAKVFTRRDIGSVNSISSPQSKIKSIHNWLSGKRVARIHFLESHRYRTRLFVIIYTHSQATGSHRLFANRSKFWNCHDLEYSLKSTNQITLRVVLLSGCQKFQDIRRINVVQQKTIRDQTHLRNSRQR